MSYSEPEMIKQALAGDDHAFKWLVERYQGFVYSIAFRFTSNTEEAEDLVQECFIKMWNNLSKYNPQFMLKPWLGKIITNLCLDFLKSAAKRNEKERSTLKDELPVAEHVQPDYELDAAELHEIILSLAGKLTPKQQAAFILRDLEQLEVDEVCDMLSISAGNLKSNLYYARQSIREGLLKHYKTPML